MSAPNVELFLASLKRCLATPEFLHRFYDVFMASSDEVREKFKKTDFPRQTRVLADSLYALAVAVQGSAGSVATLDVARLAEKHDRHHLDVRPELYDVWLECLVTTAREFDIGMNAEVEAAWRETLAAGIEQLRSRY